MVHFILLVMGVTLFLIAGFRPVGIDSDSIVYEQAVYYLNYGVTIITEPAFIFISTMANGISNDPIRLVFLVYAAIAIPLKLFSIKRYSQTPLFSFLIYLCLFYILQDFTQIRAGVSAAFFLFAYHDAINGKKVNFCLKMFCALLFHYSSVLFLPLIFFSRKKINVALYLALPFLFIPLMIVPGVINALGVVFTFLPQALAERAITYTEQIQNVDSGFGLLQLSIFIMFILYGLVLIKTPHNEISAFDNLSFKYLSLTFVLYFAFSPIPILSVRTFELMAVSLVFVLPEILKKIRPNYLVFYVFTGWLICYFCLVGLRIVDFSLISKY